MRTIQEVMDSNVDILDFSVRCKNCLGRMNVEKLSELTALSLDEIAHTRNIGKKSLEEFQTKISEIGLWWKMTDSDWLKWGLSHIEWIKAN